MSKLPTFEETQRELIQEELKVARDCFMVSAQDDAFLKLLSAVRRLADLEKLNADATARAANTASCLANGIQPD